jgi:hypothetical protein
MIVSCIVLSLVMVLAISANHLWTACFNIWGLNVSVWIGAFVVMAILGILVFFLDLYEDETPDYFIAILIGAVLLCMLGGIYFTEPQERTTTSVEDTAHPVYFRSSGAYYYLFGSSNSGGDGSSIHVSSGSSKGKSYAIMIILVVLLVVGSFIIPHFWVSAALGVLFLLWIFTLKECADYYSY